MLISCTDQNTKPEIKYVYHSKMEMWLFVFAVEEVLEQSFIYYFNI